MIEHEYSAEIAEKLVNYYKPLLVGKPLEQSNSYIISDVVTQTVDNKNFRVIAVAFNGSARFKRDVFNVAKLHNLTPVDDVLSGQGL